ncbi:MAG: glycosyltransferase family 4 protein [Candidatus Rokuibacteriota bacterium]
MRILHLMSCRGWSSDAYWAARVSRELARRGHEVTLACRAGTEARVISHVRAEGVERIETLRLASGLAPAADAADLRALLAWLGAADVVHVHRGKEHWLAAVANRLSRTPRPIVRTRHIAQAVRATAANRWLYRRATALVVTVTEAVRRQYLAAGLVGADRVVALAGGADVEAFAPRPADPAVRARLGGREGELLVGMIGGLRVMKGHRVVVEAAARLAAAAAGRLRFVFIGRGSQEAAVREMVARAGLEDRVTLAGFTDDLPAVMAALDVALYTPLESDGMSRVVWEYLAAARPLIASRVGAVAETLADGEHAVLVHAGDAGDLERALLRLTGDPALRRRLGAAGRALVLARHSGARVAATLEERYARLAA